MPKPPLPRKLDEFLSQPNPAVIATLRPDGSPHTVATRHYTGNAYRNRESGRVTAWIDVESWHSWAGGRPWTGAE
jgi:hypothetical protein